ncbi:MAG TPA: glycosyl transferase family 1, partial [Candidatus Paceibacterota bacterium]
IELMSVIIAENLSPNIKYYILTGNVHEMNEIIGKKVDLPNKQIEILSVNPEDLKEYYVKCHYGFILRDDIVVNNVSCPTKLIEYMYYGITPIVLSTSIGDFEKYGYEYIDKNRTFIDLKPYKSNKNIQIIKQMVISKSNINLHQEIFSK